MRYCLIGLLFASLTGGCLLPTLPGSQGADAGDTDGSETSGEDTHTGEPNPDTTSQDSGVSKDDTGNGSEDGGGGSSLFSEVKTILEKNCTECHANGAGATGSELRFPSPTPSNQEYKDTLIPDFVTAGEPSASLLYRQTQVVTPEMPEDGGGTWQTDEEESEKTLREWIAAGANIPTDV